MMQYENFKNFVVERFMAFMPERYRSMEMKVARVQKINRTLDGIALLHPSEGSVVSPTVYVNDLYEQYLRCGNFQRVLENAAYGMAAALDGVDWARDLDFSQVKENIVFQIINTEQNRELLAAVPHRNVLDLSVIYRWLFQAEEGEMKSAIIQNPIAEKLGLTEVQLFELAKENTRKLLSPEVISMYDMICELSPNEDLCSELFGMDNEEVPDELMLWVITNSQRINGASSILFDDVLQSLADRLEDDLYILPSSLHEVIAISATAKDPEFLANMVSDINMIDVGIDDRLSNQVYRYDRLKKELSLASDTPNKRLDVAVAVPAMVCEQK